MSDSIERQFDEADAAVTQAVTRFASEIESMFGKWEAIAPPYIIQNMLLELCTKVSKLAFYEQLKPCRSGSHCQTQCR